MGSDTGSLSAGERLRRQEEIHEPDGPCEKHRSNFWQELNSVKGRIARLETTFKTALVIMSAVWAVCSIAGPIVASFAVEWMKRR